MFVSVGEVDSTARTQVLIFVSPLSDGCVQVHRGQRCFPEVLCQDARQTSGPPEQRQRRRRGQHDLQTQGVAPRHTHPQ